MTWVRKAKIGFKASPKRPQCTWDITGFGWRSFNLNVHQDSSSQTSTAAFQIGDHKNYDLVSGSLAQVTLWRLGFRVFILGTASTPGSSWEFLQLRDGGGKFKRSCSRWVLPMWKRQDGRITTPQYTWAQTGSLLWVCHENLTSIRLHQHEVLHPSPNLLWILHFGAHISEILV